MYAVSFKCKYIVLAAISVMGKYELGLLKVFSFFFFLTKNPEYGMLNYGRPARGPSPGQNI